MKERVKRALANRGKGYNCAQAVACAYCESFGLDEKTAFSIAEGFGGGIGGMHDGICGAASAMCMLAGMRYSSGSCAELTKEQTYQKVQKLCAAFKQKNQSLICKDLLGEGAPGIYRSCEGCVEDAAVILEELLEERG